MLAPPEPRGPQECTPGRVSAAERSGRPSGTQDTTREASRRTLLSPFPPPARTFGPGCRLPRFLCAPPAVRGAATAEREASARVHLAPGGARDGLPAAPVGRPGGQGRRLGTWGRGRSRPFTVPREGKARG